MAAIGKIRSWGPLLIGVVGVALFAFIAGDLWQSCEATGNEKRMQVGEILGKKVSVQEFQALVDEYQQVIKITQGRDNLTEAELNNIQDQVWNTLVNNSIIESEAEELGLVVTKEELQNVLKEGTNPILMQTPFVNPETGRFDVTLLTKFLTEYKTIAQNPQLAEQYNTIYKYWTFMEKTLKQQMLSMKYQNLFIACLVSNPVSAKSAFDGDNTEVTVKLATIPYNSINDSTIDVSEAELKAKYDENKMLFKQYNESRDIKYVDFRVLPSVEDRNSVLAEVTAAYNKFKDDVEPSAVVREAHSNIQYTGIAVTKKALPNDIASVVDTLNVGETTKPFETKFDNTFNVIKLISKTLMPDSVQYRQLQVVGASLEEVRKRTDSIYNAINDGADFIEIANKYGQNADSIWLTSSMYENSSIISSDDKQFIDAINSTSINGVTKLELPQASIILQVLNKKAMVDKYVVAVVKNTLDFSKETYSAAYNKFSQFVSENQSIDSLVNNANKYGYVVLDRKGVLSSEHNVAGINGTREALKWIYDSTEGDISPLYECGNNDHLLVVAITKVHPVGYNSIEDVKDVLSSEVLKDKKFEMACKNLANIKSISDAEANGAIVNEISQITFGAPVFVSTTGTSEPAISGAVIGIENGKMSNVIKGQGGAYVFEVLNRTKDENKKFDEKEQIGLLQNQALNAASRFINELHLKADIEDNRYLFF